MAEYKLGGDEEPRCENSENDTIPTVDQHQIVLTDKSRASEQVVFEFPKRDPK
jgi:hypothetical protein